MKVHLVEQTVSKLEKSNGIQKINIKTPLGIALNGKSVGDTAEIQVPSGAMRFDILEISR